MRRLIRVGLVPALLVALGWVLVGPGGSDARAAGGLAYAPLNQPGPPLSVSAGKLGSSLICQSSVVHARVEPVLLSPATGVTAAQNYSWNWEPALEKLGIPWCAYTAPNNTLGDIQTSGEYLVHAIRTEYALAGRRIAILGHSQGGMSMRWALRFWPDTRSMVADVVGFSGSNHGTTVESSANCSLGCPAADWQQIYESPFIRALNSRAETFPGISYTEIWTHTDEVVQPNGSPATASAAVHGGGGAITDIPTQQICPGDRYEHLGVGTVDPVAYALAIDAITHPGPADPARISKSVCSQLYMPGVNPLNVDMYSKLLEAAPGLLSVAVGPSAGAVDGAPVLKAQPPLDCYVFAACRGAAAPRLVVSVRSVRRASVRVLVRVRGGRRLVAVPRAVVRVAGRRALTGRRGRALVRARLRPGRRYAVVASRRGCRSGRQAVRVG